MYITWLFSGGFLGLLLITQREEGVGLQGNHSGSLDSGRTQRSASHTREGSRLVTAMLTTGEKAVPGPAVTPGLVGEGCLHAGLVGECKTGCLKRDASGPETPPV